MRSICLFLALLFSLASLSCFSAPVPLGDRYVIDVRSAEEWRAGHLDGAEFIPYDEIAGRIEGLIPDRDAPIALYCRSGRRAGIALSTLQGMGYRNVVNYGSLEEAERKTAAGKPGPSRLATEKQGTAGR